MEHKLLIENYWEKIVAGYSRPLAEDVEMLKIITGVLRDLDSGKLSVCQRINHEWQLNIWLKKAILIYFKLSSSTIYEDGISRFFDKVPLKFTNYSEQMFIDQKLRVVPGAVVRFGVYVGQNAVIMPSFINIGAYIGNTSMIDINAVIGSCAMIGQNCHISSNVTVGGVLEPIQDNPVIIEDNVFIGANSVIAEGVLVAEGSVIGSGVVITGSTKIYNPADESISYGKIPPYSVVISGSISKEHKSYSTYAAIIVKQVDAKTRKNTNINQLLRS